MILLLLSIIALSWFSINYPPLFDKARVFWLLGISAMLGVILAQLIPKKSDTGFDVPLDEDPKFLSRKWVGWISLAAALGTFFMMSSSLKYAIQAKAYQLVELGFWGDVLVSIPAAIIEDIFFFSVISGLVFWIFHKATKENEVVSMGATAVIVPLTFVAYHTLVYGFTNFVASVMVFVFGLEMMLAVLFLGSLNYTHARHVTNNMGLIIFSNITLFTFLTILLTNWIVWIAIISILLLLLYRRKKR